MGIVKNIRNFAGNLMLGALEARTSNGVTSNFTNPGEWLLNSLGMVKTSTPVNSRTAMQLSAVYGAIRNISSDIGSLPINLIKEEGRRRIKLYDHPAYLLLNGESSGLMLSREFRRMMHAVKLLRGNSYAVIIRDNAARPLALIPVHPDKVTVLVSPTYQVIYRVSGAGAIDGTYSSMDILHFKDFSFDGIIGVSPIQYGAHSFGINLAAQEFGDNYFANGANGGVALKFPGALTDPQLKIVKDSWVDSGAGLGKSHTVKILPTGGSIERLSVSPNEAQMLETREFGVEEIARWFRIPPHMLQQLGRATHNNIEQQAIEYTNYTLKPHIEQEEEQYKVKLLTEREKASGNYYFHTNMEALLRGDIQARTEAYKNLFSVGAISPNQIADNEDIDGIEGGDVRYVPLNHIPVSMVEKYFKDGQKSKEARNEQE